MKRNQDKLTQQLKSWTAQHEPDAAARKRLAASVRRRLDVEGAQVQAAMAIEPRPNLASVRVAWFMAGAAVTILLGLSVDHWRQTAREQEVAARPNVAPAPPSTIDYKPSDELAKLLAACRRLFGDQLAWVADGSEQLVLGLDQSRQPPAFGRPAVAVRLVLLARRGDDSRWNSVWKLDVVSAGDRVVEIEPGKLRGTDIGLWTWPLPDGSVAIDTDLRMTAPVPLDVRANRVQRLGEFSELLSLEVNRTQYKLLQTAVMVDLKPI